MKKIFKILFYVAIFYLSTSCEKVETPLYEQSATVYFGENTRVYTFVENLDRIPIGYDTINIPLQISGYAMDYDRQVKMEVVKSDTLHTAEDNMYSIGEGYIKANLYKGYVPVRVNYSPALNDSVYVIRVRLVPSKDFPGVDLNGKTISISITNKFTQPTNWNRLSLYFGDYSNSWYKFILEVTEQPSLPYWSPKGSADPNNPDPEKWTMTGDEIKAYAAKVKVELEKYNNGPNGPMLHEDGPKKGQPCIVKNV